jgi:membrane-associated phospholipid phosphatase
MVGRRFSYAFAAYVVIALVVAGWGWLLTHPLDGPVTSFDNVVARWFAGRRTSWLDPVAEFGTLLGETPVGLAVVAVVAMVAAAAMRSLWPAALVLLADAGDGGVYWFGSKLDPRDRPPVKILDSGLVPTHSFPSGHVGTAVAVYGGAAVLLAIWLSRRENGGRGRPLVVLLGGVPLFVAASRLYEGAHHLTDVGTSLAYGTAWLTVLCLALPMPRSGAWTARPVSTAPVTVRSSST